MPSVTVWCYAHQEPSGFFLERGGCSVRPLFHSTHPQGLPDSSPTILVPGGGFEIWPLSGAAPGPDVPDTSERIIPMPTQTAKASEGSPGYVLIHESGRIVMSFYVWDVIALHKHVKPDYIHGGTVISLRRDGGDGFWLPTHASIAEVQAAMDGAVKEWKKARPVKLKVSDVKRAAAAAR